MLEYHEASKLTLERLRERPGQLDWSNWPNPFRQYEGVPVLDLPADPPEPDAPALAVLNGAWGGYLTDLDGATRLSQLLYYSASVSATKVSPAGTRYALRVNPSSGNLHPSEVHFATHGIAGWPDGLYHYRASSHEAEQRARGAVFDAPLVLILSSIAAREAWKYQERAYRYCCHDIGHLWQALALSARAVGYRCVAQGSFGDDAMAGRCGLADEWPMLLLMIDGLPLNHAGPDSTEWLGGTPNAISAAPVNLSLVGDVHETSKRIPTPASSPPFGRVARQRRSALDFRPERSIPLEHVDALLRTTIQPFFCDFGVPRVHLYLWAHAVDGLAPGVYRYRDGQLELRRGGDQRVAMAGLSLSQDLAGNASLAFSMVADLHPLARDYGDRGYRYGLFQAGAIGQRLYLTAEALGFQATGIGAFFDDRVHEYLGIEPEEGQVVYHFACGFAVPDPRASSMARSISLSRDASRSSIE